MHACMHAHTVHAHTDVHAAKCLYTHAYMHVHSHLHPDMKIIKIKACDLTLVNVYVDLVVFTRIAGTS